MGQAGIARARPADPPRRLPPEAVRPEGTTYADIPPSRSWCKVRARFVAPTGASSGPGAHRCEASWAEAVKEDTGQILYEGADPITVPRMASCRQSLQSLQSPVPARSGPLFVSIEEYLAKDC
jgi:hypothetical protein